MATETHSGEAALPADKDQPAQGRAKTLVLSALLLSAFFAMMSNTIVIAAMPNIISSLNGTQTQYTWIVTASLLTLTVLTPVWGRLSDRIDNKVLIQVAVVIYSASSIAAGLVNDAWALVACRVFIGVGAGGIITLVQLVGTKLTTEHERPRFFGYLGAVMAVATIAAPALGGLVVDTLGWRWSFFSMVPLAVLAWVILQVGLPRLNTPASAQKAPFDYTGTLLIIVSTLSLMLWISVLGPTYGWFSLPACAVLVTSMILFAVFLRVESRVNAPMIPLRLFRHRDILMILIASMCVGIATFGTSVYLTQYFQAARGQSALAAGVFLLPLAIATFVASMVAGQYISRSYRYKEVCLAASASMLAGISGLAFIGPDTPLGLVSFLGAVTGLGLGVLTQQLTVVAQRFLSAADIGIGTALVLFVRNIASVLCITVFGQIVARAVAGNSHESVGYASGIALCFAISIPIMAVGVVSLSVMRAPTRPNS